MQQALFPKSSQERKVRLGTKQQATCRLKAAEDFHVPNQAGILFLLPLPSHTKICYQRRALITHRNCSRGRCFSNTLSQA